MPDGSSIQIDNLPATDSAGYSGLEDQVDFHTWALIKGVAISTLLGVGSQLAISGQSDLMLSIRNSTQDSVNQAGQQITQKNLNIQPTIKVRPGCSAVGLSRAMIYQLIAGGAVESLTIGRRRLIKVPSLKRLVDSRPTAQ
jgi:type IV secretory pathway VirB10-like protein